MKYYSINSRSFPMIPGIYFVCRLDRKVLYIGSTKEVGDRLKNHTRLHQFIQNNAHFYYVIFFKDVEIMRKYEALYIRKYKPPLNIIIKKPKSSLICIEIDPIWLQPINAHK